MSDGTQQPISWQDFNKWTPPYQEFLLAPGILRVRGTGILFGKEGSYKTMLGLRLATAVAEGKSWLGFSTPEHGANVLYINAEVPAEMLLDRVKQMNLSVHLMGQLFIWNRFDFKIDVDKWWELLEQYVVQYQIKLVIIDPLYKVITGTLVDPMIVQKVQEKCDSLVNKYPVGIFLVSHSRKGNREDPALDNDSMYGSGMWLWWADLIMRIESEDWDDIKVSFGKTRHSKKGKPKPIKLKLTSEDLDFVEAMVAIKGV